MKKGVYKICENPRCSKRFYAALWKINAGHNVRYCSRYCRDEVPCKGRKAKYFFTPEMDAMVRKVYQNNIKKEGIVKALADRFGMPRWRVSRRALEIEAYVPNKKEPDWSDAEICILEKYAQYSPLFIHKKIKRAGFHRSETAINLKRKRLRLLQNLDGMSANKWGDLFFGIDPHWITDKINKGLLRAEKRLTERTEQQGGDIYYIKEKDMRSFIIRNPELIDLRKVEKISFIELLASGSLNG